MPSAPRIAPYSRKVLVGTSPTKCSLTRPQASSKSADRAGLRAPIDCGSADAIRSGAQRKAPTNQPPRKTAAVKIVIDAMVAIVPDLFMPPHDSGSRLASLRVRPPTLSIQPGCNRDSNLERTRFVPGSIPVTSRLDARQTSSLGQICRQDALPAPAARLFRCCSDRHKSHLCSTPVPGDTTGGLFRR